MDTVILPNGTEVTTTVAVTTNGVARARGALGRIAQFDGARYLLRFVVCRIAPNATALNAAPNQQSQEVANLKWLT